jgi:hypothetical protein
MNLIFFAIIVGYLISWTPYALVSMYCLLINSDHISPLMATIPSIFAKSSSLWSTILFILSNEKCRSNLFWYLKKI